MNYFEDHELECKCGCGRNNFEPHFLALLNEARAMCAFPWVVTSACRCRFHNSLVGGSHTSSHITGCAIDIACSDSTTRYHIINRAMQVGINRMGISETFIHMDFDPDKAPYMLWRY